MPCRFALSGIIDLLRVDTMPIKQTRREVSAKEALESIRGSMTNAEVMQKFKLNPSGYADLLKQLFEKRLITRADLERRGIRFKLQSKQVEPFQGQRATMPAVEESEEFLDTMVLTGLLSFKAPDEQSPRPPAKRPLPPTAVSNGEEEPDPSEKKKKFSLSGFLRKPR